MSSSCGHRLAEGICPAHDDGTDIPLVAAAVAVVVVVHATRACTDFRTALEPVINSFLQQAVPTSLSETIVDHDYTLVAMQRYVDGSKGFWGNVITGARKVEKVVLEPLMAFQKTELKTYKVRWMERILPFQVHMDYADPNGGGDYRKLDEPWRRPSRNTTRYWLGTCRSQRQRSRRLFEKTLSRCMKRGKRISKHVTTFASRPLRCVPLSTGP